MAYIKINNYSFNVQNPEALAEYNKILETCKTLGYTLTTTVRTGLYDHALYYKMDDVDPLASIPAYSRLASNGLTLFDWFEFYYETHENKDNLKTGYYLTVVDEIPSGYEKPLTKNIINTEPLTDGAYNRKIQYLWSRGEIVNRCKRIMYSYTLTAEQTSRLQSLIKDAEDGLELEINKYCMQLPSKPVKKRPLSGSNLTTIINNMMYTPSSALSIYDNTTERYTVSEEQSYHLLAILNEVNNV